MADQAHVSGVSCRPGVFSGRQPLYYLTAPHEAESLYPPLSYLKPTREEPTVVTIGAVVYQVVEVEIQMS